MSSHVMYLMRYKEKADDKTAEIVAEPHQLPVRTHGGLMERGLGSLEGRRRLPGEGLPSDIESSDA